MLTLARSLCSRWFPVLRRCAMAATLLLIFSIVAITQCHGNAYCQIMSGIIIFGSVLGLIGAAFINPIFLGFFMTVILLCIIGQIVLVVLTLLGSWSMVEIVFELVVLGFLIITLGFASDLRHTIVVGAGMGGPYAAQPQPQTTIIINGAAMPPPQPQTTTTIVQ